MSSFYKDFNTILNDILTDYQNQLPDVDRSEGTLCFIKSACLASALWGAYKFQDDIARSPFPDLCDRERREHHATNYGIENISALTDEELLAAINLAMQKPESGGNKYDWPRWAKEVSYTHDPGGGSEWTELVRGAWVFEHKRGMGSIDVAITSNRSEDPDDYDAWANSTVYSAGDIVTDVAGVKVFITPAGGTSSGTNVYDDTGITDWEEIQEYASPSLVTAVDTYLETKRPLCTYDFEVRSAIKKRQDVTMTVTGDEVDDDMKTAIQNEIEDFMKALDVGKKLYTAQLINIAIEQGAENASLSVPSCDVEVTVGPTVYERIWPATITIN